MITLKMHSNQIHQRPDGGVFVCPACLEDTYVFYAACPNCGADTFEARHVATSGLEGRLCYFRMGWPEMDILSHQRLKEKRG